MGAENAPDQLTRDALQTKGRSAVAAILDEEDPPELIEFGSMVRLGDLRPVHDQAVRQRARANGLSRRTALHVHRVLHTALEHALQLQLVDRNVAKGIKFRPPPRSNVPALEPDEALAVMAIFEGTPLDAPVVLALGCGLRLGEALGLRWADVDLDAGVLRIAQTLQPDGTFGNPKTHRSSRTLSIPASVVECLRSQRVRQSERRLLIGEAWNDLDLVVDRGDGSPLSLQWASRRFRQLTWAAGHDLSYHRLRHGHASLLSAAGTDLKVISERLGHSSIRITADLYIHLAEARDRVAADDYDAHLNASAAKTRQTAD